MTLIKKNEIMSFSGKWIELEITLNEINPKHCLKKEGE
jgi:hypothetical protein